jgi:exopolysaccharide production protein ExoQ
MMRKLLLGVIPMLFCAYCLYLSRSGTALLSLIAALGIMGGTLFAAYVPKALRGIVLGISIFLLVIGIGVAVVLDAQELIFKILGKDPTLTGRTYLWSEGWKSGHTRPILGHGYSAFWVHGQPLAERYWYEFYIAVRSGFHFHSTFIQTYVDIGVIGMTLISLLILTNCIATLRCLLRYGPQAEPLLLFGLSTMFLVRAFVEVDFFVGPFGMGAFLFYAILPRIALFKQQADAAPLPDYNAHSHNRPLIRRASPSSAP